MSSATATVQPHTPIPPTTPQPLRAVLLIAKTRSGPRLVAHYPPTPPAHHPFFSRRDRGAADCYDKPWDRADGDAEAAHDADAGVSAAPYANGTADVYGNAAEDKASARATRERGLGRGCSVLAALPPYNGVGAGADASADGEREGGAGADHGPDAEHARRAESLARLLAPSSRMWHKRRFEVAVEDVVFLGCPVFEREGGGWGRRRKKVEQDGGGVPGSTEEGGVGREGKGAGAAEDDAEEALKDDDGEEYGEDGDSEEIEGERKWGRRDGEVVDDEQRSSSVSTDEDSSTQNRDTATAGLSSANGNPQNAMRAAPRPADSKEASAAAAAAQFSNSISTSSMRSSFTTGPAEGGTTPEPLTMFNLVFVLQPPRSTPGEYQATVQDMYAHVVKQLSKALAYQQKRYGFVWSETRLISNLMSGSSDDVDEGGQNEADASRPPSKFESRWARVVRKSELARAMEKTYECISRGEIAHLMLGSGLSLSVQIPLVSKTAQVPTPMVPQAGGTLWLTTFDASADGVAEKSGGRGNTNDGFGEGDGSLEESAGISPYSAILLLEDKETLSQEIALQPTAELSGPLTRYIRHTMPTKSLAQLSRAMKFSLRDMQLLSLHLIHYRHAVAIPPLNANHTYIVSPTADFRRLTQASVEFGKRFAMLPSLVSILSKMPAVRTSTAGPGPQPWSSMIPSSDHKAAYMEILEWLMRGGWVTQLRTFCWVQVSAEIKAKIANQMRREEKEAAANDAMAAVASEEEVDTDETSDVGEGQRRNSSGGSTDRPTSVLSPRLRAHLVPPRPPSEAGSTSTARTAVRVSNLKAPSKVGSAAEVGSTHEHRVSDGSTKSKSGLDVVQSNDPPEIPASNFEASIVVSPHKADAVESRWLEYIASTLPDKDVREAWPTLVKYFDGQHALEEIAIREDWKRKIMAPMLAKLIRQNGLLLTVRHW